MSLFVCDRAEMTSVCLGQDNQVQPHIQSRYLALVDAHRTLERIMPNVVDPRGLLTSETCSWCNPELVQAHLAWHVSTIRYTASVQSRIWFYIGQTEDGLISCKVYPTTASR